MTIVEIILFVFLSFLLLFLLLLFYIIIKGFKGLGLIFTRIGNKKKSNMESEINNLNFANSLMNSLLIMGEQKIGALIVVARNNDISSYEKNGYKINGIFSPEFIMSIFSNKKSALHDGAVIVRDGNIVAVSAYLPMTRNIVDVKYGARHRAAIGMSERTDAIVFIVSETTGHIGIAINGVLIVMEKDYDVLKKRIYELLGVDQSLVRDITW